jgi:hypothetical protein
VRKDSPFRTERKGRADGVVRRLFDSNGVEMIRTGDQHVSRDMSFYKGRSLAGFEEEVGKAVAGRPPPSKPRA